MFLIADSGSSKTDWILIDNNKAIKKIETIGFNPYFIGTEEIIRILKNDFLPYIFDVVKVHPKSPDKSEEYKSERRMFKVLPFGEGLGGAISDIFFYGAGCSNEKNCNIIKNALRDLFPHTSIEVNHDMLAAARALWGKERGIATIIGTGSNACYYDGENIAESNLSLGYILGDEGGGDYMGKKLLRAYLSNETPSNLTDAFDKKYSLSKLNIIQSIYRDPMPNRFFASFAPFISENINHPFIYNLVYESFNDFFEKQISKFSKYKEVPMGCIGTVGFYLKDILIRVGKIWGANVTKFMKNPIEGLIEYHTK